MKNTKINVLGTEYTIETHKTSEDKYLKDNNLGGYCAEDDKMIVVADLSEKEYFYEMNEKEKETYRKKILRHEIVHAFLNESGLSDSANQYDGAWAKNEEMVDWFAIQSPKIFKVYQELGILDLHTPDLQFSVDGPDGNLQRISADANAIVEAVRHAVGIQKGI